MGADTYKGDSIQKRCVRYCAHVKARGWLSDEAWAERFHVFLASREGGDAAMLGVLGVAPARMIGVDSVKEAADAFAREWGPRGSVAIWADVADLVDEVVNKGVPLASVMLDFCGPLGPDTLGTAVRVWRAVPFGTVLHVWALKGRESERRAAELSAVRPSRRERRRLRRVYRGPKRAEKFAVLVRRMVWGEVPWNVSRVLRVLGAEAGAAGIETARQALLFRVVLIHAALRQACPSAYPHPLLTIEYQSRTKRGAGVPMIATAFAKVGADGFASVAGLPDANPYRLTEDEAVGWQRDILADFGAAEAALILNVPKANAAAMKAVETRRRRSRSRISEWIEGEAR